MTAQCSAPGAASLLRGLTVTVAGLLLVASASATKLNVMYFVVDDLRPEFLGAYGQKAMHTPAIDKLATESMVFNNAYCQQAVCGPSRASFMTGRRPAHTNVFDNDANFRVTGRSKGSEHADGSTWTTMPEHFKNSGFTTLGLGKTFHPNHPKNWDEPTSWSQDKQYYDFSYFINPNASYAPNPCPGAGPPPKGAGPSKIDVWCALDEPDHHFYDFGLANATVSTLAYAGGLWKANKKPFFVQAGFARPHAPWRVPQRFWDLYKTEDIAMPLHRSPPQDMPGIAYQQDGFYRANDTKILEATITTPLDEWDTKSMRHAYYAAVSWTDHNIGHVLEGLEAEGLKDDTVVVLHGDHGWQLGEHDSWHKFTNFELGTRVPLIIRAPNIANGIGKRTVLLAELVDVYPTLAELTGAGSPTDQLDGTSLVPVFSNPELVRLPAAGVATANKTYAYSQYPHHSDYTCPWFRAGRCYPTPSGAESTPHGRRLLAQLLLPPPVDGSFMGFSVRDSKFRYTAWLPWADGKANWTAEPYRELYDHTTDTGADFDAMDVVNVAYVPSFAQVVLTMQNQAEFFFHHFMPPTGGGGGGGNPTKVTKKACEAAGGILDKRAIACCAKSCGVCGGKGCNKLPGGNLKCCTKQVAGNGRLCSVDKAPCHA